jgi:hypothetical protein
MTSPDLELPDNLPEAQAMVREHLQKVQDLRREIRSLEGRVKRARRRRKKHGQKLYRLHCQQLGNPARKHNDDPAAFGFSR